MSYSGDDNNEAAGPTECGIAAETVEVKPATPMIVTVASPAVILGDSIKDGVTLSDGAHPTGTITFDVYGPNDADCSGNPDGFLDGRRFGERHVRVRVVHADRRGNVSLGRDLLR